MARPELDEDDAINEGLDERRENPFEVLAAAEEAHSRTREMLALIKAPQDAE